MKMWIKLQYTILLLSFCENTEGLVALSPSETVSVCNGEQLDLMCTTAGGFLEWSFFTDIDGPSARYTRVLSTISQTSQLVINYTVFTFSRISDQNSLPLTSRLSINPVGDGLNGTVVNCTNVATLNKSSTIVNVIKEDPLHSHRGVNITILSEQFENDIVTVTVELIAEETSTHQSYNILITPRAVFTPKDGGRVQLEVLYNTVYNVSVVGTSEVCRKNVATFVGLHYANCRIPPSLQNSVLVVGYRKPAPEGSNIWFICPPGMILTGPNTSICVENGHWEPDPMEVECKDILLNDVTLSRDGKIAVASSLTVFLVASTLFFIFGFLCGHSVGKKRETMVETSVAEIQTYLQDDIVHTNSESPQQNFELELTANVAYSSVHL